MKASRQFPYFYQEGIDYISAAGKRGEGVTSFLVTSTGTPDAVVFAELGLPDMETASYVVIAQAEGSTCTVDESTKATTGFSILGASAADVINVIVGGQFKGQRR